VWRSLGQAHAVRGATDGDVPLVFLTTALPKARSQGDLALRAAGSSAFFDAVDVLADDDRVRLRRYAEGTRSPQVGFWTEADLA
jgi:hypothetical protein